MTYRGIFQGPGIIVHLIQVKVTYVHFVNLCLLCKNSPSYILKITYCMLYCIYYTSIKQRL